jgi:hypothetical protein
LFHLGLIPVKDKTNILEQFERSSEIDIRLVFNNSDDKKGRVVFQADTFYGIGIPFFLIQGQEAFREVLDILGSDVLEGVDGDKIMKALDEQFMISEDKL